MLTAKCQIHLLTYSVLIYFVQINLYEIAAVGTLFIINILPPLILLLLEHYLLSIFSYTIHFSYFLFFSQFYILNFFFKKCM